MPSATPALDPRIQRVFDATNREDHMGFLAAFTPDAVLVDWSRTFVGRDAIARWDRNENTGVHARITPTSVEPRGDAVRVGVEVRGDGYNGGGAFTFELGAGGVRRLEITG